MPKPRYRDGAAVLLLLALSAASIIVFHEFSGLHHDRHTQDPSLVSPAAVVATDRLMPAREPPAIPPEFEALVLARARGGVPTAAAEHASPQESTGALANHDRQRERRRRAAAAAAPARANSAWNPSTEALKREFDAAGRNALGKWYKQPAPRAGLLVAVDARGAAGDRLAGRARCFAAVRAGAHPCARRSSSGAMPDPAGPAAAPTWRMAPTAVAPHAVPTSPSTP